MCKIILDVDGVRIVSNSDMEAAIAVVKYGKKVSDLVVEGCDSSQEIVYFSVARIITRSRAYIMKMAGV